jgi:hypothetical protein
MEAVNLYPKNNKKVKTEAGMPSFYPAFSQFIAPTKKPVLFSKSNFSVPVM